jgi:hypothetical protein
LPGLICADLFNFAPKIVFFYRPFGMRGQRKTVVRRADAPKKDILEFLSRRAARFYSRWASYGKTINFYAF